MGSENLWIIFLLVGTGLLAGGVFFFMRTRRFLATALMATGTVVALVQARGTKGGITYRPQVAFTTPEGVRSQFTDRLGSRPPRFQVGQVVSVRHDPKDPREARLAGRLGLWFVPMLLSGVGLTFAAVGIALALFVDLDA